MTAVLDDGQPAEATFPAPARQQLAALLIETVHDSARSRRSTRRSRLVVAGVATGLIGALSAGGAYAYTALQPQAVTDRDTAECYSTVTTDHGSDFPGTTIAAASSGSEHTQVASALDACGALWRAGILQLNVKNLIQTPAKAINTVPTLTACVLPDGRAAIFPGSGDVCAKAGLAALAG